MTSAFPHPFGLRTACLLAILTTCDFAFAQQGDVRHVHDPVMIKEKDTYYIFSTGRGIPMRRSKDLLNWKRCGNVFKGPVPDWAEKEVPGTRDVWAPDIAFFNGQYYLYYAVSTFGGQRSCIGLATNQTLDPDSSDYRWVDHGKVIESFPQKSDFNAIDANFVLDEEGQPWLAWGSYWGGLKIIQLDPATGKPLEGATMHAIAARPGSTAIEAPFIIHHDKHYYLFVAFDSCCNGVISTYRTLVGRSENITGPYVDFHNRPMMEGNATLVLRSHDNVRGPGHCGICRDGDREWLVHHMYDAQARGLRTLQIRPLIWTESGWPVVGEPINKATFDPPKITAKDLEGVWRHMVDFGDESLFDLLDKGRIHASTTNATWSFKDGTLELRWPSDNAPGGAWIDKCVVAPDGKSYVGRNPNGMVIRGVKVPQTMPQRRRSR